MNAVEFLINEHNKVRRIFGQISDSLDDIPLRTKLFEDLCHDLVVHEKMEQTVWYPFLLVSPGFDEIIAHLIDEENSAEKTINKFKTLNSSAKWEQLFFKLKADVENHASEEERSLFPRALEEFQESELESIGEEMQEFKIKNIKLILDKNLTIKTSAQGRKPKKSKTKSTVKKAKKKTNKSKAAKSNSTTKKKNAKPKVRKNKSKSKPRNKRKTVKKRSRTKKSKKR